MPVAPTGVQNAPGLMSDGGDVVDVVDVDVVVVDVGVVVAVVVVVVGGSGVGARLSISRAGVSPVNPTPVGNQPSTSTITSTVPPEAKIEI